MALLREFWLFPWFSRGQLETENCLMTGMLPAQPQGLNAVLCQAWVSHWDVHVVQECATHPHTHLNVSYQDTRALIKE